MNLFALRSTDPAALSSHPDPVGPENDQHLREQVRAAGRVVLAWGVGGALRGRDQSVLHLLRGANLLCLGRTKQGHPRHPLYVRGDTLLLPFTVAAGT